MRADCQRRAPGRFGEIDDDRGVHQPLQKPSSFLATRNNHRNLEIPSMEEAMSNNWSTSNNKVEMKPMERDDRSSTRKDHHHHHDICLPPLALGRIKVLESNMDTIKWQSINEDWTKVMNKNCTVETFTKDISLEYNILEADKLFAATRRLIPNRTKDVFDTPVRVFDDISKERRFQKDYGKSRLVFRGTMYGTRMGLIGPRIRRDRFSPEYVDSDTESCSSSGMSSWESQSSRSTMYRESVLPIPWPHKGRTHEINKTKFMATRPPRQFFVQKSRTKEFCAPKLSTEYCALQPIRRPSTLKPKTEFYDPPQATTEFFAQQQPATTESFAPQSNTEFFGHHVRNKESVALQHKKENCCIPKSDTEFCSPRPRAKSWAPTSTTEFYDSMSNQEFCPPKSKPNSELFVLESTPTPTLTTEPCASISVISSSIPKKKMEHEESTRLMMESDYIQIQSIIGPRKVSDFSSFAMGGTLGSKCSSLDDLLVSIPSGCCEPALCSLLESTCGDDFDAVYTGADHDCDCDDDDDDDGGGGARRSLSWSSWKLSPYPELSVVLSESQKTKRTPSDSSIEEFEELRGTLHPQNNHALEMAIASKPRVRTRGKEEVWTRRRTQHGLLQKMLTDCNNILPSVWSYKHK